MGYFMGYIRSYKQLDVVHGCVWKWGIPVYPPNRKFHRKNFVINTGLRAPFQTNPAKMTHFVGPLVPRKSPSLDGVLWSQNTGVKTTNMDGWTMSLNPKIMKLHEDFIFAAWTWHFAYNPHAKIHPWTWRDRRTLFDCGSYGRWFTARFARIS